MAEDSPAQGHHDAQQGTMDLTDHMKTWLGFWEGAKWTLAGAIVIAIFLAIFRTHN
jgi:hypothetical protein